MCVCDSRDLGILRLVGAFALCTSAGCCHGTLNHIISCNSFSDFPSSSYANFYSTKRKSAKIASDSSLKLISYLSIFASNF